MRLLAGSTSSSSRRRADTESLLSALQEGEDVALREYQSTPDVPSGQPYSRTETFVGERTRSDSECESSVDERQDAHVIILLRSASLLDLAAVKTFGEFR